MLRKKESYKQFLLSYACHSELHCFWLLNVDLKTRQRVNSRFGHQRIKLVPMQTLRRNHHGSEAEKEKDRRCPEHPAKESFSGKSYFLRAAC